MKNIPDDLEQKINDFCMEKWSNGDIVTTDEIIELTKRELEYLENDIKEVEEYGKNLQFN